MIFSISWIVLPIRTFFRLFDVMIVSRMISWLYFLMPSLVFLLMIFYISAYFIRCLSSPFSTISRRFVTRARVGGLLIALATLDAPCWNVSFMVSLMVSMSSSSRIGLSIQVGIRPSLVLFVRHLILVASWSYISFSFPPLRPI